VINLNCRFLLTSTH